MPCDRIEERGVLAIICSSGPRRRGLKCSVCGKPGADRLCDGEEPRKQSGTCNKPLHRACGKQRGEADYCPRHAAQQVPLALRGIP